MGWVVNAMPQPLYPQERDKVFIIQEVELVSQTVQEQKISFHQDLIPGLPSLQQVAIPTTLS